MQAASGRLQGANVISGRVERLTLMCWVIVLSYCVIVLVVLVFVGLYLLCVFVVLCCCLED